MARIALALLALVLSASSLSGCQRKKKQPKDEPRKVRVLPRPGVPMLVIKESLIEPGQGAKSLLRYQPLPTRELRIGLQARVELTETVNAERKPTMKLPTVTTSFELAWQGDEGRRLRARAGDATIAEGGIEDAREAARQLAARHDSALASKATELSTTDRGHFGSRPLADASSDGKSRGRAYIGALADLVMPLPEVPVGVGAKWQVVRAVPRASTNLKQTVTYELIARDKDVITVKLSGRMIGERQPLDVPNIPTGARAELLALRATVEGTLSIDLRQPAAHQGQLLRSETVHTRATRNGLVLSDYFSESLSTITVTTTR